MRALPFVLHKSICTILFLLANWEPRQDMCCLMAISVGVLLLISSDTDMPMSQNISAMVDRITTYFCTSLELSSFFFLFPV